MLSPGDAPTRRTHPPGRLPVLDRLRCLQHPVAEVRQPHARRATVGAGAAGTPQRCQRRLDARVVATRRDQLTHLRRNGQQLPKRRTVRCEYLASDEFRIEFDTHGEIGSLYDARYEREIIAEGASGNQLVLYEDRPMFWDAWDIDPFYLEKPYPIHDISEWRVVEDGPLRATVEGVETIKTADDGDGLIVRMYEAHNQRGQVCLDFGRPVESAVEVARDRTGHGGGEQGAVQRASVRDYSSSHRG
ncbi:glycoside hydrolase family 38 C-terminal domain-containing protein [Roseiflexus sp. RS-1]|jgi:hypothetical protein|uniref:glycoside hydrolase family 38 C-terminal domain-containing protein n=1 Tax=Roseiflexus sp. (strain RS-1) TaxID=357808 RepID=UPI0000D8159F|nr:glycoside hydrolase family 38 C-terminal domain-containing protein [Roseiflexus sp. RS-1]